VERRCKHCGDPFTPRPNVVHQRYCSKADCQKARKNQWRKGKLATDPDYRLNQYDAQKRWRQRHPEYWREYRASHSEYAQRNRALQQDRNHKRRQEVIAKRDESSTCPPMRSGYYRLIPAEGEAIAKSDEYLVKLDVLSGTYPPGGSFFSDCKQIT
jgi:hypothetical protein